MRSLITVLIALGSASAFQAQTLNQPGRIAVLPKTTIANVKDDHDTVANRVWFASAFAVVAGSSFDAATSWGKREANPLLGSSNGDFGEKGLAIKAGITAALIVPQIWLHKRKEYRTKLTVINFIDAGIFTGVAIHNAGLAPPPQN